MRVLKTPFDFLPMSRLLGLMLLIMIVLVQSVAHASAATPGQNPAMHQDMSVVAPDCLHHSAQSPDAAMPASGRMDTSDASLHCMPSICCFHGAMSAPELNLSGTLVLTSLGPERRVALSSHSEILKDRPPQPL